MASRRPLTGTPLLLATSAGIALAGCAKKAPEPPVGNLMPPHMELLQVCVDVLPADAHAEVRVEGVLLTDRCTTVEAPESGIVNVVATDATYGSRGRQVTVQEAEQPVVIDLSDALLPPTGNLMAPQPQ